MEIKPFILPELPPAIDYAPLVRVIGEAHGALGELNGLLIKNVTSPELLMTPLLTKEAVSSSRVEGTQETLEDVFEYEAKGTGIGRDARSNNIKEIINCRRALNVSQAELKGKPITAAFVKKIHRILLDSVRGADKDPGRFRSGQVYIGARGSSIEQASYVPPSATQVKDLFTNWERYVNSNGEKDLLVQIAVAHYQFEAIHPFREGNGRVGRLLIPLFLYKSEILSAPVLYISEYFEHNRRDYWDLLKAVTEKGAWNDWIRFFLLALITEALKTQNAIVKIIGLKERLSETIVAANSAYAASLLDFIFASPVVSYVTIKDKLKTKNPQTIYNLIDKFVKLGILYEEPGRKRNRTFVFRDLLEILR